MGRIWLKPGAEEMVQKFEWRNGQVAERNRRIGLDWFRRNKRIGARLRACSLALTICALFWLSGCAAGDLTGGLLEEASLQVQKLEEIRRKESEGAAGEEDGSAKEAEAEEEPEERTFLWEGASQFAYHTLSDREKIWYRDMERALGTMSEKVELDRAGLEAGLKADCIDRIFQCVLTDHPELFYVEGYTYTEYTLRNEIVSIEFSGNYSMDTAQAERRAQEIEEAAAKLLSEAPTDEEDDYLKIRYVYERLIEDTQYVLDSPDSQNIYSVFVNHVSVCQGYAKATQYLLNRMGVECTLVQGKVYTGESHGWNLVKCNGEYYHLDTTWGDISYQNAGEAEEYLTPLSYDYLCIPTEWLERTHTIEGPMEFPVCTATKDNYYEREGTLFASYDRERVKEVIGRRLEVGAGEVSLCCADAHCFRQMCEDLIDRQGIFDCIPAGTGESFVYSVNDRQLTLTFFLVTSER